MSESHWKPITFCNPHLVLHRAHSGFNESDARLHGEDHECAGHDPGRVIVLKLLAEHGHDVKDRADVFLFITGNPVVAFGLPRQKQIFIESCLMFEQMQSKLWKRLYEETSYLRRVNFTSILWTAFSQIKFKIFFGVPHLAQIGTKLQTLAQFLKNNNL